MIFFGWHFTPLPVKDALLSTHYHPSESCFYPSSTHDSKRICLAPLFSTQSTLSDVTEGGFLPLLCADSTLSRLPHFHGLRKHIKGLRKFQLQPETAISEFSFSRRLETEAFSFSIEGAGPLGRRRFSDSSSQNVDLIRV